MFDKYLSEPEREMLFGVLNANRHKSDRDLLFELLGNQYLIIFKLLKLMTKDEFIQAIADLKTEIDGIGTKVDALEAAINNSSTDVDPAITDAFAALKASTDALNTKADNTPPAPPTE